MDPLYALSARAERLVNTEQKAWWTKGPLDVAAKRKHCQERDPDRPVHGPITTLHNTRGKVLNS
jgi:hypothetical protein